jgi:lysophospholipase
MLDSNLRGEMSSGKAPELQDYDLVDAVARTLHLNNPKDLSQLGATLFPAMLNSSVMTGDVQKVR